MKIMKVNILLLILFSTFQSIIFGQQKVKTENGKSVLLYDDVTWVYSDSTAVKDVFFASSSKLELPKIKSQDSIIFHAGYSFLYNETHEQANWVAYELTEKETNKLFDRTDKFMLDPKVISETACDKDYEGSGYDRGHLAPAADMGWSAEAMAESFYYSNMSPQTPSFNRGIWKKLEELVRSWAIENESIFIVTGPILSDGLKTIGEDKVSIPNYYYKVILDYKEPNVKGIGFILPNLGSKEKLQFYAVSIDSVEKLTGIDFYPLLPNSEEELIEKTVCIECWTWDSKKINYENSEILSEAVQCSGITKSQEKCKNKTTNPTGFCTVHQSQYSSERKKGN